MGDVECTAVLFDRIDTHISLQLNVSPPSAVGVGDRTWHPELSAIYDEFCGGKLSGGGWKRQVV